MSDVLPRVESRADDAIIRAIVGETLAENGELLEHAQVPTRTVTLSNGWSFELPTAPGLAAEALDVLRGRYIHRLAAALGKRKPRRVLDLGAGCGAFAAWAAIAWPFAWIDVFEADEAMAEVCSRNLPPGGRRVRAVELPDLDPSTFDLVRVTDRTEFPLAQGSVWIVDFVDSCP